jgi:hypothetical protein
MQRCRECKAEVSGNYCSHCGQPYPVKRLTVKGIFHEALHLLTHFDRGFPGTMQREYVDGSRNKFQKPFSMFFMCSSFAALALYFINDILTKHFGSENSSEVIFFHKYWVLLQVCMLPLYALITWIIYKPNYAFNYAEIIVLQLYTFSFLFLVLTLIHLLKFINPHLQTRYIELPVIAFYGIVTNIKFFKDSRFKIIVKSVISVTITFLLATVVQDFFVKLLI